MADIAGVTIRSVIASWSARSPSALQPVLLVFLTLAFLLPNDPSYALFYYVAVMPVALVWWWPRRRRTWELVKSPPLSEPWALAVLLVVWSGATLIWGHDDRHRTAHFAVDTVATLFFVATLPAVMMRDTARRRLGDILVAGGCANAAFSVILFLNTAQLGPRMHGWGVTDNPILGASVMTACALTALIRAMSAQRQRAAHLGAYGVMVVFVLMTESRGPLLALAALTALLCAVTRWRWHGLAALAAIGAVWLALPATIRHHGASVIVSRGSSHRFEIWDRTFQSIADRPLFGHGLAANIDLPGITFPHNLYLSLLFYSGAVGAALFVALVVVCGRSLARWEPGYERLWLACLSLNALLTGLTDLGQITKGPGPMWFIVWLPVALLAAHRPPSDQRAPASTDAQ